MAPKKDLAVLKVKEAAMAAQAVGKRKRLATILAEDPELYRLKSGPRQDPGVVAARIG